ncbi:TPA: hypothetical protein EYP44_04570, partial [Candidatus Bathyarchaeota archaeon]|nr:hypothetical protein [Candidatus Bathyarchaeota archaeon]
MSFACHAVVMGPNNPLVSADFPWALNGCVEALTRGGSAFLNGECGDVNPLTPNTDLGAVYDRSEGTFGRGEGGGDGVGLRRHEGDPSRREGEG